MHRLYTLILICVALFLLAAPPSAAQLSASHQETFTVARPGTRITSGPKAVYHQIAWNTSGGPGACFLSLDYSTDGMVWNLAGTIPGHDCTQSGETIIAGPQPVQFVRVNVNALSNGAAIRTTYSGYQTNPGGPTGSVTSVFGRTGAIQATAGDYSVTQITGAAPIFSPNFQGSVTAPTPSPGDSSNLVATTGFVAQALAGCCGGGGGGGAVTSVFTRTGAVTAATGDYNFSQIAGTIASNQLASSLNLPGAPTAATAPVGTNTTQLATTEFVMANRGTTTGGLTGTGSNNFIPRFTAPSVLANSHLTDDGTSLLYTGTGGIVAPKLTITQGAYLLESAQAALPTTPGALKNGLVSGPDGMYVSNNNSAWFKIQPPGTGGTGGAVDSVFGRTGPVTAAQGDYQFSQIGGTLTSGQIGTAAVASFNTRTGAVVPAAGDYNVTQVTNAAPLSSPALTGTPTSTTPPLADNSFRIATTQWVKAQGYGAGGGGGGLPISHSSLNPVCVPRSSGSGAITINEPITQGDTVLVGVSAYGSNLTGLGVNDGGSSTYQLLQRVTVAGNHTTWVFTTTAGGANAGSTITVTHSGTQKMVACAMAYQNIHAIGTPVSSSSTTGASSVTVNATTTVANSVVFGFIGLNAFTTPSELSGNMLAQNSSTASAAAAGAMCEVVVPTVGPASCGVNLSSNAQHDSVAVALEPLPSTGGGGGGSGVTSFNTRQGAVLPAAGDYTVQQVTGAAGINSPSFEGVPNAPTAPPGSNSNQLATTAFVTAAVAAGGGGGGGGPAAPIVRATTTCQNLASASTYNMTGLTINQGDTVIVSVYTPSVSGGIDGVTVNDGANNTYTRRVGRVGTYGRLTVHATNAGAAQAATAVTATPQQSGRAQMCVSTYTGVAGLGSVLSSPEAAGTNSISVNVQPQDNTGVVFAAVGINQSTTFSASTGLMIPGGQAASATSGVMSSIGLCEQTAVDSTGPQCAVTSATNGTLLMAGMELRPGAGGGGGGGVTPPAGYPSVVARNRFTPVIASAGVTDAPMFACPIANCPASGYYRVSWDFLGVTSCTTGTAVVQISVDYVDASSPSVHHTGMMTSPGANVTNGNHVYGYRLMTTNSALPLGTGPAGSGINFTYSVPTACTTGTALGQLAITVERLD